MGLAASQARFLAITSRKMNCEFQSMQIAQQKLSVTRDMQKASQDYQLGLTATKLVWDTMDDDIYDLTYDMMMKPSAINQYDPYLVTDINGKIVLNDSMFNAAVLAGIINKDGEPLASPSEGAKDAKNDGTRNAFLYQLGCANQIDGSTVTTIQNLPNSYTKSGIGGEVFDKSSANALTTTAFINYLKNAKYGEGDVTPNIKTIKKGAQTPCDIIHTIAESGKKPGELFTSAGRVLNNTKDQNISIYTYHTGDVVNIDCIRTYSAGTKNDSGSDITFTDSSGNSITWKNGEAVPAGQAYKMNLKGQKAPQTFTVGLLTSQNPVSKGDSIYNVNLFDALGMTTENLKTSKDLKNVGDFVVTKNGEVMSEANLKKLTLGDILTGKYELSYKGNDSTDNKNKMEAAIKAMAVALGYGDSSHIVGLNVDAESDSALEQAFELTKALLNSSANKGGASVNDMCNAAQELNQLVTGDGNRATISLTNMLKTFLTNFAIAIDGFDCGFEIIEDSMKKSKYVTDDLNYYFLLKNDGAMTEQNMLIADFYNMIYNQICMNGACSDSNKRDLVEDKEYLAHALKNGQLFISSLNNDGYFYQGPYTLNGHVSEVPDEDARTQAEAEYNVKKGKLNYKEETLDLQMKNLDAEISALTTEFDTVKSLISKGVEKVFTMFST